MLNSFKLLKAHSAAVFLVISFVSFCSLGQENLILNGDFEEYWECPDDAGQIERCKYVYNPCISISSTSDYFNACFNDPVYSAGTPSNFSGYQLPKSGMGYLGLMLWKSSNAYYNEYTQLEFSNVLKKGGTYGFKIYVNLGNTARYTTKNIQFKFVDSYYPYSIYLDQVFEPDFRNDTLISDTMNWYPIEFEYIANGTEKYIIIGNFDNSSMTNFTYLYDSSIIGTPDDYSYFYFDDASLILLKEGNIAFPNIFTPNNDGINDIWKFNIPTETHLEIVNRWGNKVYESTGYSFQWDGENCTDGVYYYRIVSNDPEGSGQEDKSGFIQLIR